MIEACLIPEGDARDPENFVARLRLIEPFSVLGESKPLHWQIGSAETRADLIVLQRACFPDLESLGRGLDGLGRARRRGTKVIYDLDDDIFCPSLRELIQSNSVDEVDEEAYRRCQAHRALLEETDALICSTAALAEAMRDRGFRGPVYVVPTAPDFSHPRWHFLAGRRAEMRTVGWAGGSRVGRDLELLAPVIDETLAKFDDVRFVLGGSSKYAPMFQALRGGDRVKVKEWVPYDRYPMSLEEYDVGLAPLEANAYNGCKSALKAIDYNAMGVPVVCSKGSACAAVICGRQSGTEAGSTAEWVAAIAYYLTSGPPGEAEQRAMAESVRSRCGYHAHADEHWRILCEIAGVGAGEIVRQA